MNAVAKLEPIRSREKHEPYLCGLSERGVVEHYVQTVSWLLQICHEDDDCLFDLLCNSADFSLRLLPYEDFVLISMPIRYHDEIKDRSDTARVAEIDRVVRLFNEEYEELMERKDVGRLRFYSQIFHALIYGEDLSEGVNLIALLEDK